MKTIILFLLAGWIPVIAEDMDFFPQWKNRKILKSIDLGKHISENYYEISDWIEIRSDHIGFRGSKKREVEYDKNAIFVLFNKQGDLVFKRETKHSSHVSFSNRMFNFAWFDETDTNCYGNHFLFKNCLHDFKGNLISVHYLPGPYKLSEDGRFGLIGTVNVHDDEAPPFGVYDFEKKEMWDFHTFQDRGVEFFYGAVRAEYIDRDLLFIMSTKNISTYTQEDLDRYKNTQKQHVQNLAKWKQSGSQPGKEFQEHREISQKLRPKDFSNYGYIFDLRNQTITLQKQLTTAKRFFINGSEGCKMLKYGTEYYIAVIGTCGSVYDSLPPRIPSYRNSIIILNKNLDIVFEDYESPGLIHNVYLIDKDKFLVMITGSLIFTAGNKIQKKIEVIPPDITYGVLEMGTPYTIKQDNILTFYNVYKGQWGRNFSNAMSLDLNTLEIISHQPLEKIKFVNDFVIFEDYKLKILENK